MAKLPMLVFLLISSLMFASGKKDKVANFRVFVHDILGGPNPTVVEVARANATANSPNLFGLTLVASDLMTVGPDPNSQMLGRANGIAANTGIEEMAVIVNGVYVFTAGPYNGSSLSILGWKLAVGPDQELPIVGGTGVFRMARGYAVSNLYSFDPTVNGYLFTFDMHVVYPGI